MKDYYYILGVNKSDEIATIKKAYRKLSVKFHPDKNPNDPYFENRFKDINEAYEILSNKERRINYDIRFIQFIKDKGGVFYNNELNRKYEEELKEQKRQFENLKSKFEMQQQEFNEKEIKYKQQKEKIEKDKVEIEKKLGETRKESAILIARRLSIFGLIGLIIVAYFLYDNYSKNRKAEIYLEETISKLNGNWMLDKLIDNSLIGESSAICNPEMFTFLEEKTMVHKIFQDEIKSEQYDFEVKKGQINIQRGNFVFLQDVLFEVRGDSMSFRGKRYGKKIEYFLSNRGIYPKMQSNEKLNISDYKDRMEEARRLIDDDNEYCTGIEQMVQCNVNLIGIDSELYLNGLDISILLALQSSENKVLSKELSRQILEDTNNEFYAVEYVSNKAFEYARVIQWLVGYTHPYSDYVLVNQKIEEETSEIKKAELMKEYALKWDDYSWGRLESGGGMSYSDKGVEYIYFESKLENDVKEKLLLEIAESISGSGKGNAYYCLFLLYEDRVWNKDEAVNYLKKSIDVFESLPYKRFHSEMLELGYSKLSVYEE